MTGLSRKLARLETIVSTQASQATPASTYWTPARVGAWQQWAVRLLESMPASRAAVAYAELVMLPAEQWGTLTRVLDRLAAMAADGVHGAPGSPERPYGLPEAVCAALEAHPDAVVRSTWDCEDCGFMVPAVRGRSLLDLCPLCGGTVSWQGFNGRRWREMWEEQRVEIA